MVLITILFMVLMLTNQLSYRLDGGPHTEQALKLLSDLLLARKFMKCLWPRWNKRVKRHGHGVGVDGVTGVSKMLETTKYSNDLGKFHHELTVRAKPGNHS